LKKIISLKFWHIFLELFCARPATWLQYHYILQGAL
jgi:hypothetical protein